MQKYAYVAVVGAIAMLGVIFVVGNALMGTFSGSTISQSAVSTSTVQATTSTYTIDVAYPKFGIPVIDSQIQSLINTTVSEFKAFPPNPPDSAAGPNQLIGLYGNVYMGADFTSAKLLLYEYTGGAHGMTTAYGLNFDRAGKSVTLDEALMLIGKNLQQVSTDANAQLIKQFGSVQFPEGAAPTPDNYATFYISKDAVTFVFQEYQVEPYVYGMPEVSFPRIK